MRVLRALPGFWFCLLLVGCTVQPIRSASLSAADLGRFALTGRLAVQQGEAQHHLSIDWLHTPEQDEILLTTPFGQGIAEITRNTDGARLRLADRREFSAADADTLAEQVFGFRLPLSASPRWLLGEGAEIAPWRVTVVEREGEWPRIVELVRDDIQVRLKIDEWRPVE